jgi:hypothetical protein
MKEGIKMCAAKILRLKSDPIVLKSFGSAVAMNFQDNSGSVEVIMTFPEITRILKALREYETTKPEPNTGVTAAIDKVIEAFFPCDIQMLIDVPIAQNRVLLRPAVMEEMEADN